MSVKARFTTLPYGSIKPLGYLKKQLTLQKDNITSKMELYDDFSADSAWLGGSGEKWERGPYYVRGLVGTAYVSGDEKLIEKAKKWINFSVGSQRENGDFGPCEDWWAKMPMLAAIRDYYEAELLRGFEDKRIPEFFRRYFDYQLKALPENTLENSGYWAKMRGADNAETVLWFCDFLKSRGESAEKYEALASLIISQTFDWSQKYRSRDLSEHIVNITQGMKYPYMRYRATGEKEALNLFDGLSAYRDNFGRIDFLPNADEWTRDNLPTRGTETCAVVEGINSLGMAGTVLGEGRIYDLMESYGYNNLPNCFTYDISGYCYFQMENAVLCTHGAHGFGNDHGDSCAFGVSGFECCFSNMHMGYPKFIQNMWALCDGGIALTAYGENEVNVSFKGKALGFEQVTDYPYDGSVKLIYKGEEAAFKLLLRIPEWTEKCDLSVNGCKYVFETEGDFAVVNRLFKPGDIIGIAFASKTEVHSWHHNSFYIKKGAVLYCLPVKERWQDILTNDYRELKYVPKALVNKEIYPMSAWNYTFLPEKENMKFKKLDFRQNDMISPDFPPAEIKIKAQRVKNQRLSGNIPTTVEYAETDGGKTKELRLIPYGFSRLKISVFPKTQAMINADNRSRTLLIKKAAADKSGDIAHFPISAEAAFGLLQVSFPFISQHAKYSFVFTDENGGERLFDNILFNRYTFKDSGESVIVRDKYAFEAENYLSYEIICAAFEEGEIIGVSDIYMICSKTA